MPPWPASFDGPIGLGALAVQSMMLEPETEFDKVERRIEISATIAEGVAAAFEKTKALQSEGFQVTVSDIAGARFVPQSDARVVQQYRAAA